MTPSGSAYILGVGLTKFAKPQVCNEYVEMGHEAGAKALLEAHITYDSVDRAIASYCYGDSTCGQRVFYQFGMTQIPVYNVNNNCASGSTGMVMAVDFVKGGLADCVLVLGFEKMSPGSLGSNFEDRTNPLGLAMDMMNTKWPSSTEAPWAAQMFANAANEYIQKYGADPKDFAELQCCPTSDGAAAAVVVSKSFLNAHPELKTRAVKVTGQSLATDSPSLYSGSAMSLVGYEMVKHTASLALAEAGVNIADVKVAEVHDCFSSNEILTIDAIGFAPSGKGHEYVRDDQLTYGSKKAIINPSGGLISKGHPLGATGIAQCAELVWQLRGWANNRLVPVKAGQAALQQNAGLGGACVVTVLQRADGQENALLTNSEITSVSGLGYNPAVEARGITAKQAKQVRAKRWSAWAASKSSAIRRQVPAVSL